MSQLPNYNQFQGRHYETGTVANYFAYHGVTAPHTGRPPSEALLMGVSGGAVMGYFFFQYEGYDPIVRILTRNTFNPWETMLSRLGVVQHIKQTTKPDKGVQNLIGGLESGDPVVVWADHFGLPYNGYETSDDGVWGMLPLLVYGFNQEAGRVQIADRAAVGLEVDAETFHRARARVKKDKFRVATFDPPQWEKLPGAVRAGIWDCIKLYTEKPPKGSKNNFGLQAFRHWSKLLTHPKDRKSWAKLLPPGDLMTAGLISAYGDVYRGADRFLYADFLEEAAAILDIPALAAAGEHFRRSGQAWQTLAVMMLPDHLPHFAEIREALNARWSLFVDQGGDSLEERIELGKRITQLRQEIAADFPMSEEEVNRFREGLAQQIMTIHDIEADGVAALRNAVE